MDETLSIGAQAVFALSDEMQGQQREIQRLQHELNAAYRASSLASADAVDAARREAEVADARADSQQRKAEARERELEAQLIAAHEQLVEAQRAGYAVQRGADKVPDLYSHSSPAELIALMLDSDADRQRLLQVCSQALVSPLSPLDATSAVAQSQAEEHFSLRMRRSSRYVQTLSRLGVQAEFCEDVSSMRLNSVPFLFRRTVAFRLAVFKVCYCCQPQVKV